MPADSYVLGDGTSDLSAHSRRLDATRVARNVPDNVKRVCLLLCLPVYLWYAFILESALKSVLDPSAVIVSAKSTSR